MWHYINIDAMDTTVSRLVPRRFSQKMKKQICVFFCFFTLHDKKKTLVVHFSGESLARNSTYGFIWPLQVEKVFYLTFTSWKVKFWSMLALEQLTSIWMSHLADGIEFPICFQELRLLRKVSRWQLIQNSVPSAIVWRQRDIWIKPQNLKRI